MSRKPEPKPWGIAAHVWQGWAFALAGLLAVTNAAWFYTVRVTRSEAAAAAPKAAPRPVETVVYQTPDGRPAAPPQDRSIPAPGLQWMPPEPLGADERCIDGRRFKRTGNGFASDSRPC